MNILQDLRYAIRQLAANPGFTFTVVLTFALGIGAVTAIFSLASSVLIGSLPYPEPDRIVQVFEQRPDGGLNTVSGGAFKDWHAHQSSFEHLAVYETARMNITGSGMPETIRGLRVSAEFLQVLGVPLAIGRDFAMGEDRAGVDNKLVILTHDFWQRRFGGDADVIGGTVLLDKAPHTIIGVLPPRALLQDDALFLVPNVIDANPDIWQREGHWREVIGRLRDGVSPGEGQAELRGIKRQLEAQYPAFKENWSVSVLPVQEPYVTYFQSTIFILLATAAFVLLIACTNVSNLMLARGNVRMREMAIRAAVGASGGRIARQVLVESMLLALLGCAAGLGLAVFGIRLLTNLVGDILPHALEPSIDLNVLAFSVLLACCCGVLFGLLPSLRASKAELAHAMKKSERGGQSVQARRSQSLLLASQFAFTLVLLVGAGLLLRSFVLLLDVDPGFRPEKAFAFDLSFPDAKYPDGESRLQVVDAITERIDALPGVQFVGVTSYVPLSNRGATEMLSRADRPFRPDYVVGYEAVSGDYLGALGMELQQGRFITAADNRSDAARVLVINDRVARDLYPGENAVGRRLRLFGESWEIVGVVAPVRHESLHAGLQPRVYSARVHSPWSTSVVVRTTLPPLALVEPVRNAVLAVDPDQPITNVRTLEQAMHDALGAQRVVLILLGAFAAVAVTLACVGIYGVMSYNAGRRARELGIRAVLGAQRGEIVRLMMESGMKISLLGLGAGLVAAFLLARFLESLLFEVRSLDPLVFVAASASLAVIAAVSVWLPARRAAAVEPMRVLRNE